jgi:hypothetical protein
MKPWSRVQLSFWIAAIGLCVYCIVLTVLTGNIGFDGDDWWVLGWGYWHGFPGSILSYAQNFLRPGEGLYWMTMFEIFGFNRVAFHFCSLFLLALSCCLMGYCLKTAFPGRKVFVALSVWFAFFLPPISGLTYLVFTDNSRLSVLLFWVSILAFQRWARGPESWVGLSAPIAIYLLAFVTYEAPGFLIFAAPFFVWPVHMRNQVGLPNKSFFFRLLAGIFIAFGSAFIIRFAILSGGAIGTAGILPSVDLLAAYPVLLLMYIVAPFYSLNADLSSVLIGIAVAACVALQIFVFSKNIGTGGKEEPTTHGPWTNDKVLRIFLGVAVLVLGMLPYQLAGYGPDINTLATALLTKLQAGSTEPIPWFNFNEAGRIFSAASCGLAILLALAFSEAKRFPRLAELASVALIAGFAVFHAGLSVDWKEAAVIRNSLVQTLLSKAPSVESGTNFLFLDLETYHKRAAVIRGWSGLRELVKLLYNDSSLGARYLHKSATDWPNSSQQQALALPAGFVSRGMTSDCPAPHKTLVIFKRVEDRLILVEKICPKDKSITTGICWNGCSALVTNRSRICGSVKSRWSAEPASGNNCRLSLVETLRLGKVLLASSRAKRSPSR